MMPSSTSTSRSARLDSSAAFTAAERTVGLTPRTRSASRIGPWVWYMPRSLSGGVRSKCAESSSGIGRSRLARDVMLELTAVALQLADAVRDDVADRNDADEAPVVDHRHVPDPPLGHGLGNAVDGVVARAADHRRAHDAIDPLLQHLRTQLGGLPHDVALGDHAGHLGAVEDD